MGNEMDIVERAKNRDEDCDNRDLNDFIDEMAQEITRLRSEVVRLTDFASQYFTDLENARVQLQVQYNTRASFSSGIAIKAHQKEIEMKLNNILPHLPKESDE